MPILGIDTFQLQGDACRTAVKTALDIGCRNVDTVNIYENEQDMGQGTKDSGMPHDKLFVTSKLKMRQLNPKGVRATCENSLLELKINCLDLLLIH
jgi:2,5-diketo-D-gluconate reductase B